MCGNQLVLAICIVGLLSAKTDGATHTMDNVLDFFPSTDGDGLNVIWAHAVNSIVGLDEVLQDDTMMIETDIILRGIGTANQTDIPVHAHPPLTDSDLTLDHFLNETTQYPNKGMKLDFKYIEALEPSMQLLSKYESELKTPLWLNADIVIGPNSPRDPIPPQTFIDTANRYFNQTTLSLGFTTDWNQQLPDTKYTWTMIFDNLYYTYPLHPQPVTFPLRAVWSKSSWPKFVWLLGLRETFSITIWSSANDDVDIVGLVDLHAYGDMRRIFYDLPESQKTAFLNALEDPSMTPSPPIVTPWDRNQWAGFESKEGRNFVFLSTEGLGIMGDAPRAALVHTKQQHQPITNDGMMVSGRVQFVERYDSQSDTKLEVYIRSSNLLGDAEAQENVLAGNGDPTGIQYSISSNGTIEVDGKALINKIPAAECYSFMITDRPDGTIDMSTVVKTCSDAVTADPNDDSNALVVITKELDDDQEYYVIVTKSGGGKDVIVEELAIEISQDQSKANKHDCHWLTVGMTVIVALITYGWW